MWERCVYNTSLFCAEMSLCQASRCTIPTGIPTRLTKRPGPGADAATDAGGRMRRYHDIGGQPAGPVDTSDHPTEPWAKTLTAIVSALRAQGLSRVDELRRHIEDLAPQDYDRTYFERWAEAFCDLLEEKGFTSRAEIEARMAAIKSELEART